jgi:hypothetical protein
LPLKVGRMWRGIVAAAMVYGCGHPTMEGYRPAALNVPLQAFYNQVNTAAREGQMVLAAGARMQYVKAYMKIAERQLRGAELLGGPASEPTAPSAPEQ